MPVSLAAVFVPAALRGGKDEAAVLNRTRALQDMPVRFAGLPRESRRDRQERCSRFGQRTIERREAQIVTDGEAEAAPWQIGNHRQLAGTVGVGLPVAFAT